LKLHELDSWNVTDLNVAHVMIPLCMEVMHVLVAQHAGAPGIQAPQIGQQHNSQLQKSLAVPPRTGNFDTLLHSVEISDSRETVDPSEKAFEMRALKARDGV
jgi:hypothetical protein